MHIRQVTSYFKFILIFISVHAGINICKAQLKDLDSQNNQISFNQWFIVPETTEDGDDVGKFYPYHVYKIKNQITYRILQNSDEGAFAIDSISGDIKIKNSSLLTPKEYYLIIEAKDNDNTDTDTAIIRCIPDDQCVFVDPSYSGTENGTRSQPYSSWSHNINSNFLPGYAYFQKRGTVSEKDNIRLYNSGTQSAYIRVGAYGNGHIPVLDCSGDIIDNGITIGVYEDEAKLGYFEVYDFEIRNYDNHGLRITIGTHHVNLHRLYIHHTGAHNGIYAYSMTTDYDRQPSYHNFYNIHSEYNGEHGIKLTGSDSRIINALCLSNNANGISALDSYNQYIKSCVVENNGQFGLKITSKSSCFEDIIFNNNYDGLVITSSADPGEYYSSDSVFCRNITSLHNKRDGIHIKSSVSDITLEKCNSVENERNGIYITDSATNVSISKCKILNNESNGLFIRSVEEYFSASYNLISNNKDYGIYIGSSHTQIYNNTLFNNNISGHSIYIDVNDGVIGKNNIYRDEGGTGWETQSNNLLSSDDEMFYNTELNDFHLMYTASMAIDKGTDVGLESDFDDKVVPFGPAPDIGAFEFVFYNPSDTLPESPANLTGSAPYYHRIILNWTDNSDNEYGFEIERSMTPQEGFQKIFSTYNDIESYTDKNLSPETTYYYRVRAVNNIGYSDYTNEISITTPEIPPPNAPSSLRTTTIKSKSVVLRWNDNSDDEDIFEMERSLTQGSGYSVIAKISANQTSYTNTGLSPVTDYYYRIRAYNEIGYSGYSNELKITTLALQPPDAPGDLTSSNIAKYSVTLSWTDNSGIEDGFRIERSTTSGSGFVQIATVGSNITSYNNAGLSANTYYYYRVRAYNEDGNSAYTDEIEVKTLEFQPPNAPVQLSATNITKNSLILTWVDNSDNENGFSIEQSILNDSIFILKDTVEPGITSYTVTGLTSNTTYLYRIYAFNEDGNSDYSGIIEVSTLPLQPPQSPDSLNVSGITKNTITLFWSDNSDNEEGYTIYRAVSPEDGFFQIAAVEANITTFTDNNLEPDYTFYYRVQAFNEDGESDYSNTIEATTLPLKPPDAPSSLEADTISYDWVTIKWVDNAADESGFRIERTTDTNSFSFLLDINIQNLTQFTDTGLSINTTYYYRIAAYNGDGLSDFSNISEVTTLKLDPPQSPSSLSTSEVTTNTISLEWKDNSINETGFRIKRAIAPDKNFQTINTINANTTSFTDKNLNPNTTYYYLVNAINKAGNSDNSNTAIASTLSIAESKRIWDGLIAYYNFNYNPDNIIYDNSQYDEPLNLSINDVSKVKWDENNKLELTSGNLIKSTHPATKIVNACKNTNEITIECWIKPSQFYSYNPANILSISDNTDDIGAALEQEHLKYENITYKYFIRLKTNATASTGEPNLYTENELSYLSLHHIVYVKNKEGIEKLYINGEPAADGIRPEGLGNWSDNYYLILGNDLDLSSPWNGTYYTAAIYSTALTENQIITNYNAGPKDNIISNVITYNIEISPNPSEGLIEIKIIPETVDEFAKKTMIQVCNIMGDLMFSEIIEDPNREQTKSLNFSEFGKGIYIIRIISDDHFDSERFIIK